MDYRTEVQEEKKSKYNAALSQLYRIDNLWQSYHYKRRKGDFAGANQDLDSIYGELAGDSNGDKDEKIFSNFMKMIIKYRKNKNLFNLIVIKKEIWLRKLQNEQGKGTAYIDPMEDWLEE